MLSVQSETLDVRQHTEYEIHQIYCGLDNALTHESLQREFELFDSNTNPRPQAKYIYDFEKALQAPYLDVMLRGFRVDVEAREAACIDLHARIDRLQRNLNTIASGLWDRSGLNARSNKMLREFFYDTMKLKEIITSKKGVKKVSLDRTALERLAEQYLYARPFVAHILAIRDLSKQVEVLETQVDPDNRFRSSYNIAGTETGRPSSSESAMGTGGNAQNIAPGLRHVFIADDGYILFVIDFEQSEARDVGFIIGSLFGDWSYLDACESGDLHTANAKLVWPELPWTGNLDADKTLAGKIFYRDFTYRDMAKRGSHLCLTEDHEVLTVSGWVPIGEKPTHIMAWSEQGSDFEEVQYWTDEPYNNKLVYFEGNSMSLCMTENHRVPYKTDQRNKGSIDVRRAIDGPGIHMPLGWGYKGGDEEVPARLIAAFMSDGHQASTNRMHFHLKKPRKIARLKYLCELYNFQYEEVRDIVSVHGNLPKKTGAFMFEWTTECIKDFIDEYKYWDGHISKTAVSLFSVDKEHLDWIKTFGRLVGIGGNINTSVVRSDFGGTTKEYETVYHTLQQNNRLWASGKSVSFMTKPVKEPVRVLCPTVKSQFFYVRRKDKICITGNSNYMGTAFTMARHLKIPQKVADEFQARYCRGNGCAFPSIPLYWQWAIEQIQTTYKIVTPFGRERHFFGNTRDDATAREAIAFVPQSTTSDRTNLGFWRTWKHLPEVKLLAQGYDSITFEVKEDSNTKEVVREVARLLKTDLSDPRSGRSYSVPVDVKAGYNWGYANDNNPRGLRKYSLY